MSFFFIFSANAAVYLESVELRSPQVDKVELVYNVPFVEVYMTAWLDDDCFELERAEIRIEANSTTSLIPRLKRRNANKACGKNKMKLRRTKIADLDPSQESSYTIRVLGYMGWHEQILKK